MAKKETRDELLARLLRSEREKAGITQVEMAESLGVDQPWVSRHESGELKLDFLDVVDYLDVIGVRISRFAQVFEAELNQTE